MAGMADFTTPHQFLENLLSGPLAGRAKLTARLGEEARDPIEELVTAALEFETAAAPSLQSFIDWFDRGEVEIVRDPASGGDAVRVMTVHAAKGLQAPVVILADATADPDKSPRGTLHAALGLSPVAHGNLRAVDTARIAGLPGVVAVLTARDIPGVNDCGPVLHDDPILVDHVVSHVGQPVFVVVAETREAARRAAAARRGDAA